MVAFVSPASSHLDTPFMLILKYSFPKINWQGEPKEFSPWSITEKKCGYGGSKCSAEDTAMLFFFFVGNQWRGNEMVAGALGHLWYWENKSHRTSLQIDVWHMCESVVNPWRRGKGIKATPSSWLEWKHLEKLATWNNNLNTAFLLYFLQLHVQ